MQIDFDLVATETLVNAIAVVGRQIGKVAAGLHKTDEGLATARWFETFRLTGTPPDLPGISPASAERLAEVLGGDEIQAALQELLAVRLTDAPEADASRARDAVRVALGAVGPDVAAFGEALAGYYDDQISALVARLEGEEPPLLAQIRSEAFSSRQLTVASRQLTALQAIERYIAALAGNERQSDGLAPGGRAAGRAGGSLEGPPAGRLLAEVTDPFDLEVHRPVQADDPAPRLPVLPPYVQREHDEQLAELVRPAAEGASGIAVLVGGSSTGKTRACWEALGLLRKRPEPWRLWHPIDPSRPEAALRELPSIGPRTVVWLNEAQLYLDTAPDGLGERVAAGLRELLRDPARGPVLVLATLWPEFWNPLTARPRAGGDPHSQARELLTGRDISVPAAFTAAQVQQLTTAGDPRLAQAAEAAEGGQVTQFLAGAPELMARYRNAPPAAAALITAAIDARRLGMGIALPLPFLEAVAPWYLTDTEWDDLGEDWLEQALAYTAAPSKGIRGPLSRIRPRTIRRGIPAAGPSYRLADYLEQHGRRARRRDIPPAGFWKAAARFATPADLPALARAAQARGLLRDVARLRKHATAQGDTSEAATLVRDWHSLHPHSTDPNPARWAAAHAALDNPYAVAGLLNALRNAGMADQAAALLARDPAAHTALDTPHAVTLLLNALRNAGAQHQAAALADRAAAHTALDDPRAVAGLLNALRNAGMADQAAALLARDPAAHAALDTSRAVALLLEALRDAGAQEQAAALADRAAAHAALDNPQAVAALLNALRNAGMADQAAALLARDPAAHAALDTPRAVALLLDALRNAGAQHQAAALADRAAAHAALDNPYAFAALLDALRNAGAQEQAAALADRAAAHTSLDDPYTVAGLLVVLRNAGMAEQAAALLARDPAAHTALDNPYAVTLLLNALRDAGPQQQAAALACRVAAHTPLDTPRAVALLLDALRDAGAQHQAAALADRAAARTALDDPRAVAGLLVVLRNAGIAEQAAALLARDPAAHTALDNPYAVALLLDALRDAGAQHQAAALADRAAAHTPLDNPQAVAALLNALRNAGMAEQAAALLARDPAAHTALDNPYAVALLLDALHDAGAQEQAAALADRAAAHTPLDNPPAVVGLLNALRNAGMAEQAAALADRAAAHIALGNLYDVALLLDALRNAGAQEQAETVIELLPAEGRFDRFLEQADHQTRYRFGRGPDGSPAPPWGWDDLG